MENIKYLGFILDQKLSMNNHNKYVKRKIYPVLQNFMSNRKYITSSIASYWYKSLIRPILEYRGSIIFSSTKNVKNQLVVIENRCLKVINYEKSKEFTRAQYDLTQLEYRFKYFYLITFFKMIHSITPIIDESLIPDLITSNTRLGTSGGLVMGVGVGPRTVKNFGVALYNALPPKMRAVGSLKIFRELLRRHLLHVSPDRLI